MPRRKREDIPAAPPVDAPAARVNVDAFDAWIETLAAPLGPLVALGRTLAQALDAGAGLATAAVSRELRSVIERLDTGSGGNGNSWFDSVSAPLGDAEES